MQKVETGGRLVDQAGGAMEGIVASVARVATILGEITAASTEQSSGIEHINRAVAQMDEMTRQNAALVEEAAAAAETMHAQAGQLAQSVAVFRMPEAHAWEAEGSGVPEASAPRRVPGPQGRRAARALPAH